jgi:hypothetical protein
MTAIHDAAHHESLDVTKPQVASPDGGRRLPGGSTATRVFASADVSTARPDPGAGYARDQRSDAISR